MIFNALKEVKSSDPCRREVLYCFFLRQGYWNFSDESTGFR